MRQRIQQYPATLILGRIMWEESCFLIHLLCSDRQTVWCAVIGELSCLKYLGGLWWLPLKMPTLGHFACKIRYLLRMIKASSQSPALSPLYIFYEILSALELWRLREVFSGLLQVICHVIQESFITALSHFQWLYSESTAEKLNGTEVFLQYTFSQMKKYVAFMSIWWDILSPDKSVLTEVFCPPRKRTIIPCFILSTYCDATRVGLGALN